MGEVGDEELDVATQIDVAELLNGRRGCWLALLIYAGMDQFWFNWFGWIIVETALPIPS